MSKNYKTIEELKGKTLSGIEHNDTEVVFTCTSGERYRMYHEQDCCEHVYLQGIAGNAANLVGSQIIAAKEEFPEVKPDRLEDGDSVTLTNFIIQTETETVTFRWHGSSNGYYSESVYFTQLT